MMIDDPIIAEVRKIRSEILESYDWDFEKMSRDVMRRQKENDRNVVSLGKKEAKPGVAPNAYSLHKNS